MGLAYECEKCGSTAVEGIEHSCAEDGRAWMARALAAENTVVLQRARIEQLEVAIDEMIRVDDLDDRNMGMIDLVRLQDEAWERLRQVAKKE